MAIYRRGAIYWWRRNLPVRKSEPRHITVRVSLRTAGAQEAKTRAAYLELKVMTVTSVVEPMLRPDLTRDDLTRVYHLAFKTELDRVVLKQVATPMLAEGHAASNLTYAHLFTHLARCATPPEATEAFREELTATGLSESEVDEVCEALKRHGGSLPITPNQIGAFLQQAGVYPNEMNKRAVARIVAAAYRNACLKGSELLGIPIQPGAVGPLPGNLMAMLGVEPLPHDVRPSRGGEQAGPAATSTSIAPFPMPPRPESDELPDLPISELAKIVLASKIDDGSWDPERRRDIDAAVKLFVAANGDIPFSTIAQHHLSNTAALFPRLPTRYGFAKKDRVTGKDVQETIEEALERGAELSAKWTQDPVEAEAVKLPTIGLSPVTQKKHITWLSALVINAQTAGRPYPTGLDFKLVRQSISKSSKNRVTRQSGGKKKNQALLAWAPEDLRHAFSAPVWYGCAGLWQRFRPGELVLHDACYYVPLIIALHGCRSDEAAGLATDDIVDDAPIPYMHFRVNVLRRVKTVASDRKVPVSPALIRLGFLDYVRAMRALGHRALFPELEHPTLSFDHNFYDKIFEPWRATMFPQGTSRKRGRKDVDVRSIRSTCITHLKNVRCPKDIRQAIAGHEVGDVTSDIYEEDAEPSLLLPWIDRLAELIPELPTFPLNLRPVVWQKFGSPKGRPKLGES